MSDDHSLWARGMLDAGVMEREGWATIRTNDLRRMVGGLKEAMVLFAHSHQGVDLVEDAAEKLSKRVQWILDEARALDLMRNQHKK